MEKSDAFVVHYSVEIFAYNNANLERSCKLPVGYSHQAFEMQLRFTLVNIFKILAAIHFYQVTSRLYPSLISSKVMFFVLFFGLAINE